MPLWVEFVTGYYVLLLKLRAFSPDSPLSPSSHNQLLKLPIRSKSLLVVLHLQSTKDEAKGAGIQ